MPSPTNLGSPRLRVLFVVGFGDFNPFQLGGGGKGNRAICESLAELGHDVHAIFPAQIGWRRAGATADVRAQGAVVHEDGARFRYSLKGVQACAVIDEFQFADELEALLSSLRPDAILMAFSSPTLVELVANQQDAVTFYVMHDVFLPSGTNLKPRAAKFLRLMRSLDGVFASSQFIGGAASKAGLKPTLAYLPVYGREPFPDLARFDRGYVTMINPCGYKGISLFLQIAEAMPDISFAAVPAWETSTANLATLRAQRNVHLLESRAQISEILSQTRVLLLPSIVPEGFPLIINEAMLCGIPVVASQVGGVMEAMHNVDYILPVHLLDDTSGASNELGPPQDKEPWVAALRELLGSEAAYFERSQKAKAAAIKFATSLDGRPYEAAIRAARQKKEARVGPA